MQDRAISKQNAWSHIQSLGFTTSVAIEVGFYFSNFEQLDIQKKDSKLIFQIPVLKESDTLPGCDASDLGMQILLPQHATC